MHKNTSTRRLRQKVSVSDDDEAELLDAIPKLAIASDSEDLSEPDLNDDDDDNENRAVDPEVVDEDDDDDEDEEDGEDSEEAYEAEVDAPIPVRPLRGSRHRPTRETRKRQLTLYEEDDLLESDEATPPPPPPPKKKILVKLKIPRRLAPKKDDDYLEPENEYKPDVSRMTERQRARLADDEPSEKYEDSMFARMDEQLLALNRKTQKKKETAEQVAVRKAENARKRADYKIKQLEEEKRDTLNKLLKRRANKTREKEDEDVPETKQTLKPRRPVVGHPALICWANLASGSILAYSGVQ